MTAAERLEQLRDLPRVTVADRERYKRWEMEASKELALVEERYSAEERGFSHLARSDREVDLEPHISPRRTDRVVLMDEDTWRSHWRSLPDYEGPPMRAPSGVRWRSREGADGFRRLALPLQPVYFLWTEHLIAAGAEPQHPSARENREFRAREAVHAYSHPSAGGRGWCPKLAGVGE